MIFEIDDIIPFSLKYPNKSIRQIVCIDSGYLKDLFVKNERLKFSDDCFREICRMTKGHNELIKRGDVGVFMTCKVYEIPYLFDFNEEKIIHLHHRRNRDA